MPTDPATRHGIECEITDGRTTLRATVDATDDGQRYACLALEPNTGDLRQQVIALDRELIGEVLVMLTWMLAAWDKQQEARAA